MALKKNIFRYLVGSLTIIMMLSSLYIPSCAAVQEVSAINNNTVSKYDRTAYSDYIAEYADAENAEAPIVVDLKQAVSDENGVFTYSNMNGSEYGLRLGDSVNKVQIEFDVAQSGLYEVEVNYYPLETSLLNIELSVMLDDALPFTESGYCKLFRAYTDTEITQDEEGHDVMPDTVNKTRWITARLADIGGIHGNYNYYLTAGKHTVTLTANEIPFLLSGFSFQTKEAQPISYKEYVKKYDSQGYKNVKDYQKKIQAELPTEKSSTSISPSAEKTSIALAPFDYYKSCFNVLDGSRWLTPGEWVSWDFEVRESGYYCVAIKYRQNFIDGLYSSRDILIDGSVPFEELEAVHFDYTTKWTMKPLGDKDPYKIYLKEGKHTITLKNVLGDFSETLGVMQDCVEDMNTLYLDIIEITGSAPDTNRDYYVDDLIPDISDRFNVIAKKLFDEAKRLSKVVGNKGSEIAIMEDIAYQLESYADNIDSLTNNDRISTFYSNITTLSSKIESLSQQGLDLDYIVVSSFDKELPDSNAGFFEGIIGALRRFFASFFNDYAKKDSEQLRVWASGGQEQLEIVKRLVREKFTAKTGIDVSVELVSGSLQQAALAGNNPDVALNIGADTPVNFALRGAITDLTKFEDFEDLKKQYRDYSFIPYTINNSVYGVPATESFNMLFVRADIFEKMELEVPKTWSELLDLAPILQRKNMQVGMGIGITELIFQYGGKYYNDELTEVCFTDNENIEAFKLLTSFYTDYGFPISYDFLTRFRSGEMPIGITNSGMYNSIKYSAPEIDGLWEMYPLPGVEQADNTINNTAYLAPGAVSVIFENTKHEKDAWEFLKWWADSSTQTDYALKQEAILGVSSRYYSANFITFDELPWTKQELEVFKTQRSTSRSLPILPGTYYVGRCLNNAQMAVINQGENPREMLHKWTTPINDELKRKQKEFDKNNN